jgi:hypothetical protein
MIYWNEKSFNFPETDQGYAGFPVVKENEDQALGLLNGLAGIPLYKLIYSTEPTIIHYD